MQSVPVFPDILKIADFRWKMLKSAELKGRVTWFMYFLDLLYVRYNCAKFHQFRICVRHFREGELFCPRPHHLWAAPKKPILNRVKVPYFFFKNELIFSKKRLCVYLDFAKKFKYILNKVEGFNLSKSCILIKVEDLKACNFIKKWVFLGEGSQFESPPSYLKKS